MLDPSTNVLIEEALKWGISVEVLDTKENIVRLTQNERVEIVKEGSLISKISAIALELINDKQNTKSILSENGFSTPKGSQFFSYEKSLDNYEQFINKNVVIKPNGGTEGAGISFVRPNTLEKYELGIKRAFEEEFNVLIEEHCPGNDYRFLVIGNEVIGIMHRIPANVVGNGVDTIDELIRKKNELRKQTQFKQDLIKTNALEAEILAEKNLTFQSVPSEGEKIFLRYNSSLSTGGDSIEASANVHDYYKKIAIKAVQLFQLPVCGLDILLTSPGGKGSYTIVELNANPGLRGHREPSIGKPVNVGKALLDFLGFHDPREPMQSETLSA